MSRILKALLFARVDNWQKGEREIDESSRGQLEKKSSKNWIIISSFRFCASSHISLCYYHGNFISFNNRSTLMCINVNKALACVILILLSMKLNESPTNPLDPLWDLQRNKLQSCSSSRNSFHFTKNKLFCPQSTSLLFRNLM